MNKKIYIIQRVSSGIAECPILFINEQMADKFFVDLINEVHNATFSTIKEASKFLSDLDCNPEDIYYWSTKVEETLKQKV